MRLLACSGLICFVLIAILGQAQSNPMSASVTTKSERHLGNMDPAHVLYERSAFAHGYIHGYEDGFHASNIEYQFGIVTRKLKDFKEYRKGDANYSKSFGNKEFYKAGYRNGFLEGYRDGLQGDSFRAVRELRQIAAGMNSTSERATFDAAFARGYQSARNEQPSLRQAACPGLSAEYCDGFARGYQLGTTDALAHQFEGAQTAHVIEQQK